MKLTFRYGGLDGLGWTITGITILLAAGIVVWLALPADNALYVAVWVGAIILALWLLCLLSLPTCIVVDNSTVELRCLVESTYIPAESIVDVKQLDNNGLSHKLPLLGTLGFVGYIGRYIDLRSGKVHRTYVTHRHKCVAIHTSRRRYIVSCNNPQLLVMAINEIRQRAHQ